MLTPYQQQQWLYELSRTHAPKYNTFQIDKVVFNNPATIVIWKDGTKTVVKAQGREKFDKEKGLAMAICKKIYGNKGSYCNIFKTFIDEPDQSSKNTKKAAKGKSGPKKRGAK